MTPPTTSWSGTRRSVPPTTRRRILRRDPTCYRCNASPSVQVDHIRPVAEGGTDHDDNLAGICLGCHQIKTQQERTRGIRRYNTRRPQRQRATERHPGLT